MCLQSTESSWTLDLMRTNTGRQIAGKRISTDKPTQTYWWRKTRCQRDFPSAELIFSQQPEFPAACDQRGLHKWKLEKGKDRESVVLRGMAGGRGQIREVKDQFTMEEEKKRDM